MTDPNAYPADYRAREVRAVAAAARAGECVAIVGLSGAGKSNLMRFLAQTQSTPGHAFLLVDWNRLAEPTTPALFDLVRRTLGDAEPGATDDPLGALESALDRRFRAAEGSLSLLFDRCDALAHATSPTIFGNLRALRDAHKYRLTYLIALRRPLDGHNELAELFFANTLWLGPLSESDARWTIRRYAERKSLQWDEQTTQTLLTLTRGYPSFLRAACEAHAAGAALAVESTRR